MTTSFLSDPVGVAGPAITGFFSKLLGLLTSPSSPISLLSLSVALTVAVVFLIASRRPGAKPLRIKVLMRALFPRKITHGASTRTDFGYMIFNTVLFGALLGWGILSSKVVGTATNDLLASVFGPVAPLSLAPWAGAVLLTVAVFLAYELGFWLDHWTSHNIPFFWEIHKVHHTATVLTPLTIFRVHPIESLKLSNVLAVTMGGAFGLVTYLAGGEVKPVQFAGQNVILLTFMLVLAHVQHTHLWIAFTGPLGRILVSPAHHQIHHSDNPAHFGKNLGGYLAIFDWMFGTLQIPTVKRERMVFGVAPGKADDHSFAGSALKPMQLAVKTLIPSAGEGGRQLDVRRPQELVDG